ncbi:MAG: SDR family NAD(P)-dependent oxidoreductase [Bacteroidetes bacterium]|nr:MAG: SDR family NAD(P)-dependent oxidoreductase [Bacteroidota bacterium]
MARIFITGSNDGLGFLAAERLISDGHQVYLHARNQEKADKALQQLPEAAGAFVADLADLNQVKQLASEVNNLGKLDAIIHNAGVYTTSSEQIWAVNVLAPYALTQLIQRPARIIYLSSGMHRGGGPIQSVADATRISYSDSKFLITSLLQAWARLHQDCIFSAVDPGWVPTKMGGKNAPDDLQKGFETQVWLAASNDPEAVVSGGYYFHRKRQEPHPGVYTTEDQERLMEICSEMSGL